MTDAHQQYERDDQLGDKRRNDVARFPARDELPRNWRCNRSNGSKAQCEAQSGIIIRQVDPDFVQFGDRLYEAQSQPASGRAAAALETIKAREDIAVLGRWYSWTAIGHSDSKIQSAIRL